MNRNPEIKPAPKQRFAAARRSFMLVSLLTAACTMLAQNPRAPEPAFAPISQYLMERDAEIALAQSAAPPAISRDADVLVLGRHGYETAITGTNGFVCIVQRGWTADYNDKEFGSPSLIYPICYNAPAARSYLPIVFKKTELALSLPSRAAFAAAIQAAFDEKELPDPAPDSMCYMMSKSAYFGQQYGRGHPHLMFFVSATDGKLWGAGLPGSPIMVHEDAPDQLSVYLIPVAKWSDGTIAPGADRW